MQAALPVAIPFLQILWEEGWNNIPAVLTSASFEHLWDRPGRADPASVTNHNHIGWLVAGWAAGPQQCAAIWWPPSCHCSSCLINIFAELIVCMVLDWAEGAVLQFKQLYSSSRKCMLPTDIPAAIK